MTFAKYAAVYAALMALTLTTFGLSFASLGSFEWPVALGIALIKSGLIALFFMHLVEMSAAHRLAGVAAATLLAVLILLAMADVWTSPRLPVPPESCSPPLGFSAPV